MKMSSLDRIIDSIRRIVRSEFSDYSYTGIYEYSIQAVNVNPLTGAVTVDAEPTDTTLTLPSIPAMPFRGSSIQPVVGQLCLVSFVNRSPKRPIIVEADGSVATEHFMTTEATALLIYNSLVALMAAAGGGPLLAVVLQPLLGTAIATAMTAQAAPAPPGLPAQIAAAAALQAGFATGVTPSPAIFAAWSAAIEAMQIKTPDVSGQFPSVGCPNVKGS